MAALVPVFTLKLNQKVLPGLVTAGRFDGAHVSLAAATSGGKVFIHSPHNRLATVPSTPPFSLATTLNTTAGSAIDRVSVSSTESDVVMLSFGQRITSLAAGNIQPGTDNDVLMIGSQTNLLVYDVRENCDLFYKELHDGANAMLVGRLGKRSEPLLFVGGNCSIQGFDPRGEDQYWTVTGDNVCCLALSDFNSDGKNELIVGSEDYDIRVFEDDELINELTEADAVVALCHLRGNRFGYALANGIVGVYGGSERFWRIKSKNQPLVLYSYDIDGDGVPELVIGWSNGKVDARSSKTGDVLFKDSFSSAIAGIVQADYRRDGKEQLICISVEGEIRGYLAGESTTQKRTLPSDLSPTAEYTPELKSLEELNQKRKNLLLELKTFETNEKVSKAKDPRAELSRAGPMGVIPAGTMLKTEFSVFIPTPGGGKGGEEHPHIELSIETSNDTILRCVVIFAEGLFEGESRIVHPPHNKLSNTIKVPLFPDKDTPLDLSVKAFVGKPNSTQFHVFEAVRPLTRFALYVPCPLSVEPQPAGSVVFNLTERLERVLSWVNESFMYGPTEHAVTTPYLHLAYMSLRTGTPLIIRMDPQDNGKVTLCTDDMDLAGDIVQSLAAFMSIEDLDVVADFPRQMEDLETIISRVEEFKSTRQRLTAEMADNSGVIRNLVVRAEDARIMDDMANMKKAYQQLYQLNRDLIMGYQIRSTNHLELLECLRMVNQAIQKAGKLRVGKPKAKVIASCREAVKNSDSEALSKAIKFGCSCLGI